MTKNLVETQSLNAVFTVVGSDGKLVPASAFSISALISDPTVVSGPSGALNTLVALKAGTATVQWTVSPAPGQGYSGAPLVLAADTIVVAPKVLASATIDYSVAP